MKGIFAAILGSLLACFCTILLCLFFLQDVTVRVFYLDSIVRKWLSIREFVGVLNTKARTNRVTSDGNESWLSFQVCVVCSKVLKLGVITRCKVCAVAKLFESEVFGLCFCVRRLKAGRGTILESWRAGDWDVWFALVRILDGWLDNSLGVITTSVHLVLNG